MRPDAYLSQNRFRRSVANVLALDALFVEVDYQYVPGLETRSPESIREWAAELSEARIPAPSYAGATGRWSGCMRRFPEPRSHVGARVSTCSITC